jgi:hypothetical protein
MVKPLMWRGLIGGPDRDRTDDLFHAMEARSQLRHRPTLRKDFIYSQTSGPLSQTGVVRCNSF